MDRQDDHSVRLCAPQEETTARSTWAVREAPSRYVDPKDQDQYVG